MRLKAKVNGVNSVIELDLHQFIKFAKVTNVVGSKVRLKFDDESEESSLEYTTTVTCNIGDKVIGLHTGNKFIVIGVTNSVNTNTVLENV